MFEREAQAGSIAGDDVAGVDSTTLHDAIVCAVEQGWLISFGSSRDGGATSLAVLRDGEKHRVWCSGVAELQTALEAVVTAANGSSADSHRTRGSNGSGGPTAASGGKGAGGKGPSKSGG